LRWQGAGRRRKHHGHRRVVARQQAVVVDVVRRRRRVQLRLRQRGGGGVKVRADESAMHEGPQHVHGGAERGARQHQLCVCVCNVRSWRSQHTNQPMAEKKKTGAVRCIAFRRVGTTCAPHLRRGGGQRLELIDAFGADVAQRVARHNGLRFDDPPQRGAPAPRLLNQKGEPVALGLSNTVAGGRSSIYTHRCSNPQCGYHTRLHEERNKFCVPRSRGGASWWRSWTARSAWRARGWLARAVAAPPPVAWWTRAPAARTSPGATAACLARRRRPSQRRRRAAHCQRPAARPAAPPYPS